MKRIKVPDISFGFNNYNAYNFTTLEKVIQDSNENPIEIVTIESTRFTEFSLKKTEFHYVKNPQYWDYYSGKISSLLQKIGYFNFKLSPTPSFDRGSFPSFTGNMQDSFIKLEGECYTSEVDYVFTNIYSWLELFLKTKPEKIRCEFWMTYYNTSAYRRILTFIKALDKYYQETKADVRVYWYDSDDIDIRNDGEDINKVVSLNMEFITVDEDLWEKMNK